jgi:farnesyl diphosphate synthase
MSSKHSRETIEDLITHHDKILHQVIAHLEITAPRIRDAIHYALFPGGKRLRPVLVYLCGELLDVSRKSLDIIAAAIELTHCYSLIHDDLPAMDNDDFRRGRLSCHRAFDEATAILTGDALQILAIDILLNQLPSDLSAEKKLAIMRELSHASGPAGMISGQSLDLSELAHTSITETQLRAIHLLKTGKLMLACINMTIAASDTSNQHAEALRQFAYHLGLVFQMQDDYLDRYDQEKHLGKGRSSDEANKKTTFATLYHQDELHQLINNHYQQAISALKPFGERAERLINFTQQLHHRTKISYCDIPRLDRGIQ